MSRSEGVRRTAAIAIAGGVIGLVLTPPMASIWAYDPPSTQWESMHWVERTFGPTLESWGALSFGWSEHGAYEVYGKGFFLVYAAMAPIMRLVHQRYRAQGGTSRWELRTWQVMWWSLLVCAAADFASYWGISVPGPLGEVLWGGAFSMELVASLVLLASTTIYGAISLRLHIVPVWASLSARGSDSDCRRHVGNRGRLHPERVRRTSQCHLGRLRRDASRPIKESTSAVRGTDCLLVRR